MGDLIGEHLGQYEIVALLGEGGMAAVYRAHQPSMERDVAIKVIKQTLSEKKGEFIRRFEREARTAASLSHTNILKVFDYGQQGDLVYLVMEMLTGGSLAELIRRELLSSDRTGQLLDQIASALDYAHRKGIIHRDVKPQNVLLDESGMAHLTDFGIVKLLSETTALTQSGLSIGTPTYMAPEQWQGRPVDARADLYALGVMLFEMLAGRQPFVADTPFALMHQHIYDPPPSIGEFRPDLPSSVERVLDQALAKDPEQRFQTASDLAAAFKGALAAQPEAGPPTGVDRPPPSVPATMVELPPAGRHRRAWSLAGMAATLVVLVGVSLVIGRGVLGPVSTAPAATASLSAAATLSLTREARAATSLAMQPSFAPTATASPQAPVLAPPATQPPITSPGSVPTATEVPGSTAAPATAIALPPASTITSTPWPTDTPLSLSTTTSLPTVTNSPTRTPIPVTVTPTTAITPSPTATGTSTLRPTDTPLSLSTTTSLPTVTNSPTRTPIPVTATPTACQLADVNHSGTVDVFDMRAVAALYGSKSNDSTYDARMDLDGNGEINIFDVRRLASQYGQQCK